MDAEQIAAGAEARFQAARADVEQRLVEARETALTAVEDSSKAFWALFGALLLGMVAAIGGAVVASDRGRDAALRHAPSLRGGAPRGQHVEAYP